MNSSVTDKFATAGVDGYVSSSSSSSTSLSMNQQSQSRSSDVGVKNSVSGNSNSSSKTPATINITNNNAGNVVVGAGSGNGHLSSAVPMLKVMRIQAPELACFALGNNNSHVNPGKKGTSGGCGGGGGGGVVNRQYYNRDYYSNSVSSWMLPDSFGVIYIGETFRAYLGAINASDMLNIYNLQIVAQLQTPSTRLSLPTSNLESPQTVPPLGGINAIVTQTLQEVGPHILRVEVTYGAMGDKRTLRKFYRFSVSNPLYIRQLTTRAGDADCYVSIVVQYSPSTTNNSKQQEQADKNGSTNGAFQSPLLLTNVHIQPPSTMTCRRIDPTTTSTLTNHYIHNNKNKKNLLATTTSALSNSLLDSTTQDEEDEDEDGIDRIRYSESVDTQYTEDSIADIVGGVTPSSSSSRGKIQNPMENGLLYPGQTRQFLFHVSSSSNIRGIAAGDELGIAMVTWKKAMGETGRIASTPITCPSSSNRNNNMVMTTSGLSVDAAVAINNNTNNTASWHPIMTVEPIDPPKRIPIGVPTTIQLLIVHHGNRMDTTIQNNNQQNQHPKLSSSLQLQFSSSSSSFDHPTSNNNHHSNQQPSSGGISLCGPSAIPLSKKKNNNNKNSDNNDDGDLSQPNSSTVVSIRIIGTMSGCFTFPSSPCAIVDMNTGFEFKQPLPLFHIYVDRPITQSNNNHKSILKC